MSEDNKDNSGGGKPDGGDDQKDVKRKIDSYDTRIYNEQMRQVQTFPPLAPLVNPNQLSHPNLFPHQSYPTNLAPYNSFPNQQQHHPPMARMAQSAAPVLQGHHSQYPVQHVLNPSFANHSIKSSTPANYNSPSFNFPNTNQLPKLQANKKRMESTPDLPSGSNSQDYSRHNSAVDPHSMPQPYDYNNPAVHPHQFTTPYFNSQQQVPIYYPVHHHNSHPILTAAVPPQQHYPMTPQYYIQHQEPVSRTSSLPQIPYASSFQHHHEKVVPPSPTLIKNQKIPQEFFPIVDDSSASEDSDFENGALANNVYGDSYLKSLMKETRSGVQESSDTNFVKLCFLLEVDCCAITSCGSKPYICDPLDSLLLNKFITNTAPWLDVYCSKPLFTQYLPQISLCEDSSIMYNSILSCGALFLHRDRPETFNAKFALKYYNSALKLLSMKILQNERVLPVCLICSILLNHYEDFAGEMQNKFNHHAGSRIILQEILNSDSNYKKRRSKTVGHKQLDLNKLNSLEHNEFLESAFWVITNNDLQESLKWEVPSRWSLQNPNTTVLSLSSDVDYDEKISEYISNFFDIDFKKVGLEFFEEKDVLWWLRKGAYNLQLINDYSHQTYVISYRDYVDNTLTQKWIELKKLNDNYGKFLPASLRKIAYINEVEDSKFPEIKFKDANTAIINLNYHLSCLLLYDSLIHRTGVFSQNEEEANNAARVFNREDREFLTNKKNLKNLIKKHSVDIIGILKSYDGNITVWSLNLGHFKIALRFLKKYDEYHKELDSLVKEIQEYTKTRFNRV